MYVEGLRWDTNARTPSPQFSTVLRLPSILIEPETGERAFAGTVKLTEPLGGDLLVDVALEGSKLLVKAKPSYHGVSVDTCYLTFDRERWHLFSKENGQAYF